jgi:hypothetical protein
MIMRQQSLARLHEEMVGEDGADSELDLSDKE